MSKVIVITGGGEGLGRALALRLTGDGHKVVLLGRTLAKLESVVAEIGSAAMAVTCDVGQPDSVRKAFAEIAKVHPKIDVLINNAAIYGPTEITTVKDEQVLTSISTNLAGPIFCTRAAVPMLPRGGHIINISSESVDMRFPHLWLYQCTKAGMEHFSKSMAADLEPQGIRVTVVQAGSMWEPGRQQNIGDPVPWMKFHEACLKVGVDLQQRPISLFTSSTEIIRAIINLPPDVQISRVNQHPWRPD